MRKPARPNIPKGVRFKVLTRDRFTCQYCGRSAPHFVLHIDHVEPISKGGRHSIDNFVTACIICNAGKYDMEGVSEVLTEKQYQEWDAFDRAYAEYWGEPAATLQDVADTESLPPCLREKSRRPLSFDFDVLAAAAEIPAGRALPPVEVGWEAF